MRISQACSGAPCRRSMPGAQQHIEDAHDDRPDERGDDRDILDGEVQRRRQPHEHDDQQRSDDGDHHPGEQLAELLPRAPLRQRRDGKR